MSDARRASDRRAPAAAGDASLHEARERTVGIVAAIRAGGAGDPGPAAETEEHQESPHSWRSPMLEAPSSRGDAHPPKDAHELVEAPATPVPPPRPPQRKAGAGPSEEALRAFERVWRDLEPAP
jgi:hypothetical protein